MYWIPSHSRKRVRPHFALPLKDRDDVTVICIPHMGRWTFDWSPPPDETKVKGIVQLELEAELYLMRPETGNLPPLKHPGCQSCRRNRAPFAPATSAASNL